jgi:hypothetical protein
MSMMTTIGNFGEVTLSAVADQVRSGGYIIA